MNRGRAGSQFGSYNLIYITLLLVLTPVLQVEKNSELGKKPFKPLSDEPLFVRELTSRDGSSLVARISLSVIALWSWCNIGDMVSQIIKKTITGLLVIAFCLAGIAKITDKLSPKVHHQMVSRLDP